MAVLVDEVRGVLRQDVHPRRADEEHDEGEQGEEEKEPVEEHLLT